MESYSLCQAAFDRLSPAEQAAFSRIAPPVDPAKLAAAAFLAALALGLVGGALTSGRVPLGAAGGVGGGGGGLPDYAELPPLSPAEALVALVFRPPGR
mmetsp:Transcript_41589/g.131220  ORF Transcript_41589/g.131220 Transcript_41589/m.131220 type:complete len:98 (+) Transcript_41589:110-403(+)